MRNLNLMVLIGNVGKAPEVRYTQGGKSVGNFSVATNEYWTGADGQKAERTEWHRIVVWGKLAEFCQQYVQKGSSVFVVGKTRTRSYEDRDGKKLYVTEIHASELGLLEKRAAANGEADEVPTDLPAPSDNDVPF